MSRRRATAHAMAFAVALAAAACARHDDHPPAGRGAAMGDTAQIDDPRAAALAAREQDVVAGLPLARRVHVAYPVPNSRDSMVFDGYYAASELACIDATPPRDARGYTQTRVVYDGGVMLAYRYERHVRRADGALEDQVEHLLFAPSGEIVAAQALSNGHPKPMPRAFHAGMARFAHRLAVDQADDVRKANAAQR